MTDVDLDCAPDRALRVVKVALDETAAVTEYTVEGDVITARTSGGPTSFGERVFVELPRSRSDTDTAKVSVTADRRYGLDVTANPWKPKSEAIEEIKRVRTVPAAELPDGGQKEVTEGPEPQRAVEPGIQIAVVEVVIVMLLILLVLGGLVVALTLV